MVAQFPPGDEIMHILWGKKYADELAKIFRHTFATGESYATSHRAELRADRGVVEHYQWRVDRITLPDGSFGVVCYFRDALLSKRSYTAKTQSGHWQAEFATMPNIATLRFRTASAIIGIRTHEILYRALGAVTQSPRCASIAPLGSGTGGKPKSIREKSRCKC